MATNNQRPGGHYNALVGPEAQAEKARVEQICFGWGRALEGNASHDGKPGAIPKTKVRIGTAVIAPEQFGLRNGADLAPYASRIHGTIGDQKFSAVTDVIGGKSPTPGVPVRQALMDKFPKQFLVELPGGKDRGYDKPEPVTLYIPPGLSCPIGTTPRR